MTDADIRARALEIKQANPGFSWEDVFEKMVEQGYDEDQVNAVIAALEHEQRNVASPRPSQWADRPGNRGRENEKPGDRQCHKAPSPSAPFRFVALNDRVELATETERAPLDKPRSDGYCGRIEVTWTAETPLLIGQQEGKDESSVVVPMAFGEGNWVVPGASLRGMLRAVLEIITFGRLSHLNAHRRYGLRDFLHPDYAGENSRYPVGKVTEVKAGWLSLRKEPEENGEPIRDIYRITPCQWSQILIEENEKFGDREQWVQLDLKDKYQKFGMLDGDIYDFGKLFRFSSRVVHNNKDAVRIDPHGTIEGVLVFSDKIPGKGGKNGKKVEYVFHGPVGKEWKLSEDSFRQFRRMYSKPAKNKSEPDGTWKKLQATLKAGKRVPVFYVGSLEQQGDNFAFGLTRLFKVPHRYSLGEIRARSKDHATRPIRTKDGVSNLDLVETLFGYVLEGDQFEGGDEQPRSIARKGKVAFSFGTIDSKTTPVKVGPLMTTVMMAPRPSFAPFYLAGPLKDYSDSEARLAGRKRYLPRYDGGASCTTIEPMLRRQIENIRNNTPNRAQGDNPNIQTRLRFLVPDQGRKEFSFTSTIRLHNVGREEIGAVLWALTHGGEQEKYRHMLGRAKPFGAGQIRVDRVALTLRANRPGAPAEPIADLSPFLKAFEARMGGNEWRDSQPIEDFLTCSRPGAVADGLDYLPAPEKFSALRRAVQRIKGNTPVCHGFAEDRLLAPKPSR
ncbi:TIGR03986 family CRISPR-associated RAMP protein [Phaeospirillum tilakii]|uniref:TIGR03986 family CRISPR-associated RAMP protein n=1 Tax=Phaeospirillum tilakii TaxID=741673 RepID=A0ABW5C744_9PROT